VQSLVAVDWMILLIYFFFVISIGLGLRQSMSGGSDYLLAGRTLPAWLCGLAMTGASLGALEVLAMGGAAARFGLASASFFSLGSVIPLIFAGLYLVPRYYASSARSLPDYLRLRFGAGARSLAAVLYLAVNLLCAAIAFYVMARAFAALHLFDIFLHAQTVGSAGAQALLIGLAAVIVLILLLTGGLAATLYAQVMQFLVLMAAFLPMVLLGIKHVGGWSGLKAALPTAQLTAQWHGLHPGGIGVAALAAALGVVLTAGSWCADQSLLQAPLAAESVSAARRAPLIAAAVRALLPLVLVLPGVIAIALPTPQSTTFVHTENGAIYHEINVVPQAAEAGQGLVPARTDSVGDPLGGAIERDASGHALLNYGLATPNLLAQNLPNGLLGFALAALLACLTSGVAARAAACSTIFTLDLWQPLLGQTQPGGEQSEPRLMFVGRLAGLGAVAVSAGIGCAMLRLHGMPGVVDLLVLSLAILAAPLLATFVLAAYWLRTTSAGACAGLLAGFAAAVAHYGLTLAADTPRGLSGGWIAIMHHYAGFATQGFWTAIFAIAANLLLTVAVSLFTAPSPHAAPEVTVNISHSVSLRDTQRGEARENVHNKVQRRVREKPSPNPWALVAFALLAAIVVCIAFTNL
jgi:solute:Na+ symporter, SSS family